MRRDYTADGLLVYAQQEFVRVRYVELPGRVDVADMWRQGGHLFIITVAASFLGGNWQSGFTVIGNNVERTAR